MSAKITLGAILQNPAGFAGSLYLPAPPWNLDTEGAFVVFDKDADPAADQRPEAVKQPGWREVLDDAGIEDIVDYARAQRRGATLDDLLRAFIFYVEEDAFLDFEAGEE